MARGTKRGPALSSRSGHIVWLATLVLLVLLALNTGSCNQASEARIGQGLGHVGRSGNPRRDYKYVADMVSMRYWPNQARYVNAIPKENRVYIADDEMLAQFSGYSRGD